MKQASRWLVLALAGLVVAACSSPSQQPAAPSASDAPAATRSVTHEMGTTEIPSAPQRVVSASITMTGALLGLDVPVVASGTTRPGGVADDNGFFLAWAQAATDRNITPLGGPVAPIEGIAAAQPDLIIGSAVGADAVTSEAYAQLSAIAPTIVLNHSALSWQELSRQLGADLGREREAAAVEQEFTARASTVAARLDGTKEAAIMTVTAEGFNVFTAESAQGKLLTEMGLRLKEVAASGDSSLGQSGQRRDVVPVAGENAGEFGDASLFFVNATEPEAEGYRTQHPVLGALPAFAEGRDYALGPESFRLDRYSAAVVLDTLEAQIP